MVRSGSNREPSENDAPEYRPAVGAYPDNPFVLLEPPAGIEPATY